MKTQKFKSLIDFINNFDLSRIDNKTLIITDIDGVFFKSIFDPREIIGLVGPKNLEAFEKMTVNKPTVWLFTNRPAIFKHFPFVKQFRRIIQNFSDTSVEVFTSCQKFLEENILNHVIILNAKKPDKESQKVVEKGIDNFEKVIYVGAKDLPFYFTDERLLQKLEKNEDLENLTFIKISRF